MGTCCIQYNLWIYSSPINVWAAPHKDGQVDGELQVASLQATFWMYKQMDNWELQHKLTAGT